MVIQGHKILSSMGSTTQIDRRDLFDDKLDKDSFSDDDEANFFDFDLDEIEATTFYSATFHSRPLTMRAVMSIVPVGTYLHRLQFLVIVWYTYGFLNTGLYDRSLNLFMHSAFSKLWNWCYEILLSHDAANERVHEHDLIGQVARLRLQLGVQLSTLNHLRYRGIKKSGKSPLLSRSHGVTFHLDGVHTRLFNGSCD